MQTANKIGPWPIIDPGLSKISDSSALTTTSGHASINVRLDTANLGGNKSAFTNVRMTNGTLALANNTTAAFGVALQAPINLPNQPYIVQLSGMVDFRYTIGVSPNWFIGFCDSDTPVNGWDATDNLVPDFVQIPTQSAAYDNYGINTQVLIQDIVSGDIRSENPLIVGFFLTNVNGNTHNLTYMDYMISACYREAAINTSYVGV